MLTRGYVAWGVLSFLLLIEVSAGIVKTNYENHFLWGGGDNDGIQAPDRDQWGQDSPGLRIVSGTAERGDGKECGFSL